MGRFFFTKMLSLLLCAAVVASTSDTFSANLEYIQTVNALNLSYTLGVNQFTALTNAQYSERFFRTSPPNHTSTEHDILVSTQLPTAVDWTAEGAVSAVIDQGDCGSCWAIATAGAIESARKIAGGQLVPLAVQQWMECDYGMLDLDLGCQGGNIDSAMGYATKHALCAASSYPYTATDNNTCQLSNCTIALKQGAVQRFNGVARIPEIAPASEQAMMAAVAQQPVAAWIEADKPIFQHYKSGVLSGSCGGGKDHAVLVVGYGTEKGNDYWKVKNSFGESWGMSGYVLLKRGGGQRSGECGVLQWPTYPVLSRS